jgi:hypothetical protein
MLVCYLMAHQQLRTLEAGISVVAIYCHTQDMASKRVFNVTSAHPGYLRQELVSPKAGVAISRLIWLAGIWPWEYSCLPTTHMGEFVDAYWRLKMAQYSPFQWSPTNIAVMTLVFYMQCSPCYVCKMKIHSSMTVLMLLTRWMDLG